MITEMMREPLANTVKYVRPVRYDSAKGLTAKVYDQLLADFLPAPLVALHSSIPEVMAGVWSTLRETLMTGRVKRVHKEAVAVTISKINECPFCVNAHTVLLRSTSDHDVADAILQNDYTRIRNPQIRALVQWIWANRISNPNVVVPEPFSLDEVPEIIGTAITFHYLNRMANVFLGDGLLPFPMPSALKEFTYRLYAATEGRHVLRHLQPGTSLKLLSEAVLPDDLSWAGDNPTVAGAFAGFSRAIEEAGQQVLPDSVRLMVKRQVQMWNGESMGISRHWVEEAIAEIATEHQPSARLALLTAFASYQVDSSIVDAFRLQYPEDAQLIAVTAWSSFAAARRVGEWLVKSFKLTA